MPSILLCYGAGEGQTRKVAARIARVLDDRGYAVTEIDAENLPPELDVAAYDAAVVGACLDGVSYQQSVRNFVRGNRDALSSRPSGFFQVSRGRPLTDPGRRSRAREFAEGFFESTGWYPDLLGLFGGALIYSRYGFLTRLRLRWSVGRATGDTDTSRDYEYTDWAAVERFAEDVAAFVARELDVAVPSGTSGDVRPGARGDTAAEAAESEYAEPVAEDRGTA